MYAVFTNNKKVLILNDTFYGNNVEILNIDNLLLTVLGTWYTDSLVYDLHTEPKLFFMLDVMFYTRKANFSNSKIANRTNYPL